MKKDEFLSELLKRFPALAGAEKKFQRDDIAQGLEDFSENSLDRLWDLFKKNYDRDTPPRLGSIIKIARDFGLGFSTTQQVRWYVMVCDNCQSYFGGHRMPKDPSDEKYIGGERCHVCWNPTDPNRVIASPAKILVLNRDVSPWDLNFDKFGEKKGNLDRSSWLCSQTKEKPSVEG